MKFDSFLYQSCVLIDEMESDESGSSRTMEPIQYGFMDYEAHLDEETLQEGPTKHDPNKPGWSDFDF